MKSKKLVGAIVAVVMSASLAAGLSACGKSHSHSWQWKDVGGGYHRQECTGCDETTSPVPHRDEDGNNLCDDCKVDLSTVVEVTSVTLDRQSATLTAGGATLTLRATVTPAGAATVVWTSSDKSVATVSDSGVVTPLKAGDVVITATAGGKSDTCSIKVNAATSVTPVDMTAEKWEQAFTFGDKVGFEQTYTCGDESGISAAKFDGDNCYIHYRDRDFEQEAYIEVAEKKSYIYSRAYEYWTKTEIPGSNVGQSDAREILDTLIEMFPFDKFEKGTANGEYVAKEAYTVTVTSTPDEPQTFNITEAKINFSADGKIVSMEHVAVEEDIEEKMSTTFTYGVTLTMPEVLEGEKVTAEEWAKALAMTDTNYRLGLVTNGSRLDFEYSQNGTDKKFSGSEYFIGDNEPLEIYFAKEGEKFYRYKSTYGHWSKAELNEMTDEIYGSEITGFGFIDVDLSQYPFEAFTYDENSKMYVFNGNGLAVTAMFKDKQLVLANMVSEYSVSTIEIVYGDAQVTLPEINAGEQVTADEWAAAFDLNFDNFEMNADCSGTTDGKVIFKKVGDTIYQCQNSGTAVEMYVDKQGGKYYMYAADNGVWKKTEIEKSVYDSFTVTAMFGALNMSDFTWDGASGSYKNAEGNTVVKFADKKIDTAMLVISLSDGSNAQTVKMYFSYGTAEITLPKEGSSVSGGNQGGPIVKPEDPTEKDITAEEWQQIFEHTENSEKLTVNIDSRDENISYIFNEEEGYIYVTEWLNGETHEYVYALDNEVVYKFEFDIEYGQITKTATEYTSLAEIKTEILNGCYLFEDAGNVKDLYDKFHGNNGDYYFQIGEDGQLGVRLDGGKLLNLNYNNRDDYVSCNFEYNLMTEPYWYLEYKGRYLTEEEWYKAFEMDYDKIFIRGTDSEGNNCAFAKDGGNYYIENYGNGAGTGMKYYSAENGNFYRFDSEYDETAPQSIRWTKIQITEAEYTKDTRVNMLGEYNFTEFSFNEDSGSYENSQGTCEITFSGKRITEIVNGLLSFSIGYYGNDLDLPQDKLTEAEWAAAISATLTSTNFKFNHEHFGGEALAGYYSYFDIDNGLIYREAINGSDSDNLLYVVKNGNTYLCQYDGEDGYTETILNKTLQEVFEEIAQEMLTPSILDGKTIAESYSDFEYFGYGDYILDLGNDVSIRVLVKNGKLSSVEVTTGVNEQTSGDRYTFSNYGETDVETELPWWYTNRNNEIN